MDPRPDMPLLSGLYEMTRLAVAKGANPLTLAGDEGVKGSSPAHDRCWCMAAGGIVSEWIDR
jgi:hypothetical protein